MVFTLRQRTEFLNIYEEYRKCVRRTARMFNERHPSNLSHKYVTKFRQKKCILWTMTNFINESQNIFYNIWFTDEGTFFLNVHVNNQNYRFWRHENPRLLGKVIHSIKKKWKFGQLFLGIILFIHWRKSKCLRIDPLIKTSFENQIGAAHDFARSYSLATRRRYATLLSSS